MNWTRKTTPALAITTAMLVVAIGERVVAQAPKPADHLPQPLPREETRDRIQEKEEADRRNALPVPVSPPTILRPEVQPIDLDTALRLAGVQNPELNVARQRVLEAVAVRQLAAARFLPSRTGSQELRSSAVVLDRHKKMAGLTVKRKVAGRHE